VAFFIFLMTGSGVRLQRRAFDFSCQGAPANVLLHCSVAPASPDLPVTLDVRFDRPYPCTIGPDPVFVGSNHIPRSAMAAVDVQAVAVALQLMLFLAKPLFVGPQVRG
jgi:hypothetical protein